ncbi:MAG: type IV secretory system conjugative DNA transfer family protein [Methyloglobulus sp.]|nr:type IV secretory system conjugative DNA transfer family protein [Methyloglobulus sp.]
MNTAGKLVVVLLLAVSAGLYLSGYFFLFVNHQDPLRTTPLTILQYGHYYGGHPAYRKSLIGSTASGFAVIGFFAILAFIPRSRALHGEAKFASRAEINARGLLSGSGGILMGKVGGKYISLPGQQGAILSAPPRSGKGVGVVVPNLLNFPGSVIVVDIKRENWEITAGFRQKHGQQVFLFDPLSETGETARWNPLHYVSGDPNIRVNDIQRIAEMLFPAAPGKDSFWVDSARTLFLGITLYLFETPSATTTIGEVLRQGMSGGTTGEGFVAHWKRIIEGRKTGENSLSWQCVASISDTIDLAPQTASGIRKEFTSKLSLWLNPLLDAATSGNDFDLGDLRKKPISIYVGVTPDNLERIRPVISLFFQQAIGLQTRELPEHNKELKHQLLLMLDEFTALGRIPIIETACGFLPGYNVRVMLVIQTPSQLRSVYGRDGADTIMKTLAARILFAPKDFNDAQEISNELGSTTVKGKSKSRPMWGTGKGNSTTESEQRRMLLLPQEVKEIGKHSELIIYEDIRPIQANKIIYYEDKLFKSRLLRPPKVVALQPANNQIAFSHPQNDEPQYRRITLDEIANFDKLPLQDISVNTQNLFKPSAQPRAFEEIKAITDSYLGLFVENAEG